jgi:predicted nuclease of predicted toxin-antitoxin system
VKFLFDENLSPRLVSEIASYWPDSAHVETLNMRGASDESIWRYAQTHGFTIVSKDDDFRSLALVLGAPPKVVWLQIGNSTTAQVAQLLRTYALELQAFSLDPNESLLSLSKTP